MTRLILTAILAIAALSPAKAFTTINIVNAVAVHGIGTSMNVSMANGGPGMVAGNLALVSLAWTGVANLTSVTDEKGSCGGYTALAGASTSALKTYYCNNVTSGASTITAAFDNTLAQANISAWEINGQDTSTPFETPTTATPTSTTTPLGASITTAYAHTMVVATMRNDNQTASNNGIHAGNAFTSDAIDNGGAVGFGIAHNHLTSCSTTQPQWDFSVADSGQAVTISVRETGTSTCGGGATSPNAIINFFRCCHWR